MQHADDDMGFSVAPKTDCPHVLLPQHYARKMEAIDVKAKCAKCSHTKENWYCLACSQVFCGRYVNGHMAEHFKESGHGVALSFADLSFWCYFCDSYIINKGLQEHVYSAAHHAKFGSWPGEAPLDREEMEVTRTLMTKPVVKPASSPAPGPTLVLAAAPAAPSVGITGLDSKLLQDKVVDRILGCIYGNALGDAYGLATEFMYRPQIEAAYAGTTIPFPKFKRNGHNSRWAEGDWTDDTDQMILILDTIVECKGQIDDSAVRLFARKLKNWVKHGFPELGDWAGMGLGATVASVLMTPTFLDNPHATAEAVWERMNRNAAANGAVMRTSICGCYAYSSLSTVLANTRQFSKVTHYDERCQASCVAVTAAIAWMLQGKYESAPGQPDVARISAEALALALKEAPNFQEAVTMHMQASLAELKLDEPKSIGYTLKCLGSGFWALRSTKSFKETMHDLIRQGGDADTNGAVAGALLGCRIGYSQLPQDWLAAMPNKVWLDAKVVAFLQLMGLAHKP